MAIKVQKDLQLSEIISIFAPTTATSQRAVSILSVFCKGTNKNMRMKKNIIIIILCSVISFAAGCYLERTNKLMVKSQALSAAARYMDSVQKVDNNMKVTYSEIPYSKELERRSTKINNNGYVPDAKAAVRMAVSVWSSLYGEYIPHEKPPIKVTLKNDSIWIVQGTLLPDYEGGTPYIEISKNNGTIYKVSNGK